MASATIVVVDDTDEIREIIVLMLQHEGYTVYSFANARDVLAISKSIRIDLFLIDIIMPGTDGLGLVEELNVKENSYEVITITGKNDEKIAAQAKELGVYGHLQKPFSFNELIAMVEFAIASAAAKRQRISDLVEQRGC
jgi:DNA-binding NtrC family response regulator